MFMDFVHTAIPFLSADENDTASIPYNHKAVHRTRLTFRKLMKSNIHARKHHKHPEPRSTVSAILLSSFVSRILRTYHTCSKKISPREINMHVVARMMPLQPTDFGL